MVRVSPLLLALAALALGRASADDARVHVRVHHKHAVAPSASSHTAQKTHTSQPRKVFHVSGSKAAFDQVLAPAVQKKLQLDVWRVARFGGGDVDELQADIAATEDAMASVQDLLATGAKAAPQTHGKSRSSAHHTSAKLRVKEADFPTEEERATTDHDEVAACLNATQGYEKTLADEDAYTESKYFDCFRPYDQIWQFFDTVAEANPEFVSKTENISTTFEGRGIHAYKLSTSSGSDNSTKKAVYTQSLIHAREWEAGASTHFTFASLLDDLRAGDAATLEMFDEIDWYFVPLTNVDGYKYSWEVDRYWRVSRHPSNGFDGVDLNRNYPPEEYFNVNPTDVDVETNPGPAPLSEPETRGLYKYMMGLPNLIGVVDVHAYAGMVLRPFSDVHGEPEEPYGSAMKRLGDAVRDAMSPTKDGFQYISQPSGELYPAYGCIDDAVYRETNYTVPALTIEVEGNDFIAPQDTIRKVGEDLNNGLRRFVQEALVYESFIEDLASKH